MKREGEEGRGERGKGMKNGAVEGVENEGTALNISPLHVCTFLLSTT